MTWRRIGRGRLRPEGEAVERFGLADIDAALSGGAPAIELRP